MATPMHSRPLGLDYSTEREYPMYRFFNQVYAWMFVGLAVTAVTGIVASSSGLMVKNPLVAIAAMIGTLILSFVVRPLAMKSAGIGLAAFLIYSTLMGVLTSYIYVRYSMPMLGSAFVVTAGVFGGMSLVGFVTKKDLSGLGGMALMALIGLILASIVNIFTQSTAFGWMITYGIVAVFVILTAYDTQKLKEIALANSDQPELLSRVAVVGSLELYMDFINLFLAILRIMGSRK